MAEYKISQLASLFGLSRSTLLYYDKINVLTPSGRTHSGYRYYSEKDRQRLEQICCFRAVGLKLDDIRMLINRGGKPDAQVLSKRIQSIGQQINELRQQQYLLTCMLKTVTSGKKPPVVDKDMWVEMLRAAGMDDDAMKQWHIEFERRAPERHHDFLIQLGIPENEVQQIRKLSSQ